MWFCTQIGAREHFAVPRALHQQGRLGALYTDYWAGRTVRALTARSVVRGPWSCGPIVSSLASRFHPELAQVPVKSWNWKAIAWEAGIRRKQKAESRKQKLDKGVYSGYVEVGRQFAVRVRDALEEKWKADKTTRPRDHGTTGLQTTGLRTADHGLRTTDNFIFFAYDTGALEALEWCKERGIKTVLDQIDPGRVEVELVQEEEKRWPGWQARSLQVPDEFFRRHELEWALADRVVVNSDFSRDALVQQGVPLEKLVVIPLCYEKDTKEEREDRREKIGDGRPDFRSPLSALRSSSRPLRVLFLGQVILRKGIQYLMEAARLLEGEYVQFDIVGPVGISEEAVKSAPRNLIFHGRSTRDQAGDWYRQADLFVLPTLSDGFAITQLEAMAYGLPVVTTPCCGKVVTDGLDGFIVPPRDAEALAKVFQRYLREPTLLQAHQAAALEKSKQFTLNHLSDNLLKLETELSSVEARSPVVRSP